MWEVLTLWIMQHPGILALGAAVGHGFCSGLGIDFTKFLGSRTPQEALAYDFKIALWHGIQGAGWALIGTIGAAGVVSTGAAVAYMVWIYLL